MANFCGKCGTMLDANGKCPKCGNVKGGKPAKQPKVKKEKNGNAKNRNISLKIIITVLVLASVTLVATVLLMIFGVIGNPFSNGKINSGKSLRGESTVTQEPVTEQVTEEPRDKYVDTHTAEDFTVDPVNADDYYNENAQIVSKVSVSDSSDIHSESEAYNNLTARGFTQYDIMADYDMEGNLLNNHTVSKSSNELHPSYYTYYITPNGEMWTVFEINGTVMASPVYYDSMDESSAQLIIAEGNSLMCYDSYSDSFYSAIPNGNTANMKSVLRVDAETLDGYFHGAYADGLEEGEGW